MLSISPLPAAAGSVARLSRPLPAVSRLVRFAPFFAIEGISLGQAAQACLGQGGYHPLGR